MVKKIVFTGGPCAGKTTVISVIEKELREKGFTVFVVRESATELINGGITPHKDGLGMFNFQRLILEYQYRKEEIYNKTIMLSKLSDIVVIYDRGILDNKAYISDLEFSQILTDFSKNIGVNLDEIDLLNRYDMVIHLETSAFTKGYSLDSNKARYESSEEAILLDNRTKSCWSMHNNFYVIHSSENFEDKINSVKKLIYGCLENKKGISRTRKK